VLQRLGSGRRQCVHQACPGAFGYHERRIAAFAGTHEVVETVQNPSWAGAAGALVSTLPDLTRFFRALLARPRLRGVLQGSRALGRRLLS